MMEKIVDIKLILHSPDARSELANIYKNALSSAVELYIVSAYLTEWDDSLKLNSKCRLLRIVIGKDFGITRKAACRKLLKWLPAGRKTALRVADGIGGFHPKGVFWKDEKGICRAVIGSSNLTKAAFDRNFEANVMFTISAEEFEHAKTWIRSIDPPPVPVSEDWLSKYVEAPSKPGGSKNGSQKSKGTNEPVIAFKLPRPPDAKILLKRRRSQLEVHRLKVAKLDKLFLRCAAGQIRSAVFYERLPKYWGYDVGNRLQGQGWNIKGKGADFMELARSYRAILDASNELRDDVVAAELDYLEDRQNAARGAFLSEILCLRFPDRYPVLNKPVWKFISAMKFKAPRGATEGAKYIDLAIKLRASLARRLSYPAKNLAELDTLIWAEYGEE